MQIYCTPCISNGCKTYNFNLSICTYRPGLLYILPLSKQYQSHHLNSAYYSRSHMPHHKMNTHCQCTGYLELRQALEAIQNEDLSTEGPADHTSVHSSDSFPLTRGQCWNCGHHSYDGNPQMNYTIGVDSLTGYTLRNSHTVTN